MLAEAPRASCVLSLEVLKVLKPAQMERAQSAATEESMPEHVHSVLSPKAGSPVHAHMTGRWIFAWLFKVGSTRLSDHACSGCRNSCRRSRFSKRQAISCSTMVCATCDRSGDCSAARAMPSQVSSNGSCQFSPLRIEATTTQGIDISSTSHELLHPGVCKKKCSHKMNHDRTGSPQRGSMVMHVVNVVVGLATCGRKCSVL